MSTAVRSHAKINLGLYIGGPRPDGYHALTTVYQTLELYDVVTVAARRAGRTTLRLTSDDSRVPTDSRNTAWKMVELALDALKIAAEVHIHIEKRLPVQGGLGAGSANAVAALVGLEAELKAKDNDQGSENIADVLSASLSLPGRWKSQRLALSAQVGSDVPLFLIGGTVLGLDRGQAVFPLPDLEPVWCVVATPEVGISTPLAFRDWDQLCAAEGLTTEASTDKLSELSRAYASAFAEALPPGRQESGSSGILSADNGEGLAGLQESALVRTGITSWIENDFEQVVFPRQPSLAEIKRLLAATGNPEAALCAMLSGSGSALFGLYPTRGDAQAACERLQTAGVASQLTRTLPRAAYWREMLLE